MRKEVNNLKVSYGSVITDDRTDFQECFYCGGTTERCLPYAWYFPGCELNDVRHNKCWVNISAVIIVVSVIAGILLVIFISCLCYCCCRFHAYRQARAKKQGEKWNFVSRIHSFVRVDVRNGVRPVAPMNRFRPKTNGVGKGSDLY
ncbi:unnamed protein product [Heligmosomoides polygyrus]|uniref:PSI domain-containing protein n=1 Tax=Heligmosomoides polygyrus TaxID=6339 RepID=A0A183FR33_HELPZ|nr:unnamed protein product [Heligmosomoides polygyrus]